MDARQASGGVVTEGAATCCFFPPTTMDTNHDDHSLLYRSSVQFQMPHFVLGGTPHLAHGGGAEALPGMYRQGPHGWTDYDKYWCRHLHLSYISFSYRDRRYEQNSQSGPPKDYTPSEIAGVPPSSSASAHNTSRPFEFDPPPVGTPPSPDMRIVEVSDDHYMVPNADFAQDQRDITFANAPSHALAPYSFPASNFLDPTAPLPPLPANGLPLYSASGFDMLHMLAKVATRPNPRIMLGPVDMTCSFVVVDVRRLDSPIVYASPTFTRSVIS